MRENCEGGWTHRILAFLASVGVSVRETELGTDTFLPGLGIRQGAILLDRSKLAWPGDLLHEAGHIAVIPAHLREGLEGTLHGHDAIAHAGELEAMAWAYAACLAIGMPAQLLFHAGGYRGAGAGLELTYSMGVYPGLPGLSASGMALTKQQAAATGEPAYPQMISWLRS